MGGGEGGDGGERACVTVMLPLNSEVNGSPRVAVEVSTAPAATPGSDASGMRKRKRLVVSVPCNSPLIGPGP